jgi:hypothetical protein
LRLGRNGIWDVDVRVVVRDGRCQLSSNHRIVGSTSGSSATHEALWVLSSGGVVA